MRTILVIFGIFTGVLQAQEVSLLNRSTMDRPAAGRKLWLTSVTALTVANVADVHSSWGKHELNGALSNNTGTFGTHGALIKLGFQGSLVGVEYLITRGHPSRKLYRALSFINFGAAGAIGTVAAHNYTVPALR